MITRIIACFLFSSAIFVLTDGYYCSPEAEPVEGCGIETWHNTPCSDIIKDYYQCNALWAYSCCSLSDSGENGCQLTVDGPNSQCCFYRKFNGDPTYYTSSGTTTGTCPPSQYVLSGTHPPTTSPAPIASFTPAWFDRQTESPTEKPSTHKPTTHKPVTKKPVTKKPVTKKPTKKPVLTIACKKRNEKCVVQRGAAACCGTDVCRKSSIDSEVTRCLSCLAVGKPCARPGVCCSRKCSPAKRCVN